MGNYIFDFIDIYCLILRAEEIVTEYDNDIQLAIRLAQASNQPDIEKY